MCNGPTFLAQPCCPSVSMFDVVIFNLNFTRIGQVCCGAVVLGTSANILHILSVYTDLHRKCHHVQCIDRVLEEHQPVWSAMSKHYE